MTSAMLAAKAGRAEQLKVLEQYLDGETVYFRSHQGRDFEAQYDPTVFETDRAPVKTTFDKQAVFLDAAATSDEETLKTLLDEGVDPNTCTADGLTALHQASIENSIKVAGLLLNAGAHVNRIDNDWWTPLHAAAACDHWRIVNLLIANGAKTDVVNVDGDLPVDLAEGTKTKAILETEMQSMGFDDKQREKLLGRDEFAFKAQVTGAINTGADLNMRGWNQESLLHVAACNGWADTAKQLIDAGCDVNAQDEDGDTPLHLAAFFEQYKMVELLGESGANANAKNRFLDTPLVMTEDATMVRLLKAIQNNQKIAAEDKNQAKPGRRRTGSSVKRKSRAEKGDTSKADAKRMMEAAAQYAEMNFNGDQKRASEGEIVYSTSNPVPGGAEGGSPRKGSKTSLQNDVEYAVPEKRGSKSRTPTGDRSDAGGEADSGMAISEEIDSKKKKSKKVKKEKETKQSKKKKAKAATLSASDVNAAQDGSTGKEKKDGTCTIS
eukprot:m.369296 g.369296  ORF g.369296 m.369296 type:complete len:494 (-) comp20848_c0_seq1:430-1911(-)